MSATAEAYILFVFFIIVMFLLYGFFQKRLKIQEDMLNNHNLSGLSVLVQNRLTRRYNIEIAQSDQNRVYNISSHVQNQNQTQYPDGHLSMEHITITNELNKPPKYDDAPPTYEEAVKLAMAHSNSIQTFQAEQQQNHEQPQTSSSSTAPAMVHAAPHRTTE